MRAPSSLGSNMCMQLKTIHKLEKYFTRARARVGTTLDVSGFDGDVCIAKVVNGAVPVALKNVTIDKLKKIYTSDSIYWHIKLFIDQSQEKCHISMRSDRCQSPCFLVDARPMATKASVQEHTEHPLPT